MKVALDDLAFEPAPAVLPAFQPHYAQGEYFSTAEQRQSTVASLFAPPSAPVMWLQLEVCRSDGQAKPTAETAYTVDIKELRYPGTAKDVVPVDGKWVYAFRDGKLAAEARAVKPGVWEGHTGQGSSRRTWRSDKGVRLDPGPKGQRYTYSFFLSPVQLTAKAIDFLCGKQRLSAAAVPCAMDRFGKTVLLTDPLLWAADAHCRYYRPLLRTFEWWQYDEKVVAHAFVANVLKAWIANGDPASVGNELRKQPGVWLDERKSQLEAALGEAEKAAAYVAHCVDSAAFFATEMSCLERRGEELELAAVALAAVTEDLLATEPGKRLAQQLASDPQRLPRSLIFNDDRPRLPDEWFQRFRFGHRALLGIFEGLLPAAIQMMKDKGEAIRVAETQRDRIGRYLANLAIKTTLNKPQAAILAAIQKGEKISAGQRPNTKGWNRIQAQWKKLVALEEAKHGFPTREELLAEKLSKKLEPFESVAKGLTATVGSVIELINVALAYQAVRDAQTPEERARQAVSMVGAISDLVEHGGGLVEDLLKECAAKRALKGVTGLAGAVGGVIDMLEYEEQLSSSLAEYDYGKSVGRGMQVAGAAAGAAGGAMVLVGAFYGTSLGPLGTLVGAIGGALVAAGFLVAKWLSHNANETFAIRCFLGKQWEKVPAEVDWSGLMLPTRDAKVETRVLIDLLSQFQLGCFADLGDWAVLIYPGLVEERVKFELDIYSRWGNYRPQRYRVHVDLDTDEAIQTAGARLKAASKVCRGSDGQVEYIYVNLEEASLPQSRLLQYQHTTVKVRLVRPGGSVPSDPDQAVKIELPGSERPASIDHSTWAQFAAEAK